MGKIVLTLSFIICFTYANNIYETNCVSCHKKLPVSIDKFFYRYLLEYSSEKNVKATMFNYMKIPDKKTSIMPDALVKRLGIKEKTKLTDEQLNEALDIYWEKYKVFGKIK